MIAVDTNVLVYASDPVFPRHESALRAVERLAGGTAAWALPIFVVGEWLRVLTHPRILTPPSTVKQALDQVTSLLESPSVQVLMPQRRFWPILTDIMVSMPAAGNLVHDAQIAAVCLEHGASTILTEDRAFARIPGIRVKRLR